MPEPEAFVLLKPLLISKRRDPSKIEKGADTARSLWNYFLNKTEGGGRLRAMFSDVPKGWQQKIRDSATEHFLSLLKLIRLDYSAPTTWEMQFCKPRVSG